MQNCKRVTLGTEGDVFISGRIPFDYEYFCVLFHLYLSSFGLHGTT